jgi:hypothetical protein
MEEIGGWLRMEGWKLLETQPKEGVAWALDTEDPNRRKIGFLQLANRPEALLVYATVSYGDEENRRLGELELKRREEYLWDLRFRLLAIGVWFSGVEIPLRKITVNRTVYTEGLTRRDFMEDVGLIQRALAAVLWTYQRHMGEQPAADEALPVN